MTNYLFFEKCLCFYRYYIRFNGFFTRDQSKFFSKSFFANETLFMSFGNVDKLLPGVNNARRQFFDEELI